MVATVGEPCKRSSKPLHTGVGERIVRDPVDIIESAVQPIRRGIAWSDGESEPDRGGERCHGHQGRPYPAGHQEVHDEQRGGQFDARGQPDPDPRPFAPPGGQEISHDEHEQDDVDLAQLGRQPHRLKPRDHTDQQCSQAEHGPTGAHAHRLQHPHHGVAQSGHHAEQPQQLRGRTVEQGQRDREDRREGRIDEQQFVGFAGQTGRVEVKPREQVFCGKAVHQQVDL